MSKTMRVIPGLKLTLATALAICGTVGEVAIPVADAVQLSDGRVYFVQPPQLLAAVTTERQASATHAVYYFTVRVPESAGEPLQRITVVQRDGDTTNHRVLFTPDQIRAFVGTRRDRGAAINLSNVNYDRDNQTVTLDFAPPVQPGTVITIGLEPERNPRIGGVYLFGVTAFPAGRVPYGQFLGYGRIDINDRGDNFPAF
jgi:hypothetical protein